MWKPILLWLCLSSYCLAGPLGPKRNMPIIQRQEEDMEKQSTAVATNENEASKPEAANIAIANGGTAPSNMLMISTLTLPSNATSIRADITDGFSCANKSYGYYADVENDCQIFHVCLPVTYADGKENIFRWSFICPEETIFSQDSFTCMRREDMTIDCEESFKYYELNRNFGVTDDEEKKQPESSISDIRSESEQDQETAMTSQVLEHEKHIETVKEQQQQQQQQMILSDKLNLQPAKPSLVSTTQKEKPIKKQKPNRRKPSNNSNKKKPTTILNRKTAQPVTAQPVIATTVENSPLIEETKPPRYTKRPALSVILKEKFQPVKLSEPTPVRVDLYNQKRKRPSIFNKKDATTIRPAEEVVPITEVIGAQEPTLALESEAETPKTESTDSVNTISNLSDPVASEASETSAVVLKPDETIETKKISPPQPTEPEAITPPELTTIQENPLEAIEEIPAVIMEVEETNSNQKTVNSSSTQNISTEETHEHSPAIFQQNSEESFSPIKEMEQQKPDDTHEIISAIPDMEHQDPMIEQMLSDNDTEANKQTMGGFKPVDPAMAAEAEALIANFLNTLMKSEKPNNEPTNIESQQQIENIPEEQISQETKPQAEETDVPETNSTPEKNVALEQQTTPLKESVEHFPSMMMMMNNHPGEIFQIPVQVIQNPIEEELTKTPSTVDNTAVEIATSEDPVRPISIDDIVELVKDKLDQVPATEKAQEMPNIPKDNTRESIKMDSIPQEQTEQLIVPIYQRVSSKPNDNMITAHSKDENSATSEELIRKPVSSENIPETETNIEPEAPTNLQNLETQSNMDRTQRARSIKTALKMDPRKRRFLFKSDAS